ncbi:MAG: hypothetical protein KY476_04985 [Planctomycetes bacterium]|nr:hypothetical protein [Planctomycetota bacterium]
MDVPLHVGGAAMSVLESLRELVECAKALRACADEVGATAIKERLVDELLRLQELRESLITADAAAAVAITPAAKQPVLISNGGPATFQFEPSATNETYSLVLEQSPHESAAAARPSAGDTQLMDASDTVELAVSAVPASAEAKELTESERFALAEQRIADLEPLHQAALRRMNDLLTEGQRRRKAEATRAGVKAGLKGRALQQAVMDALDLSPQQQQAMTAARKELHDCRQAIARQVEGLLSKEQLDRMLHESAGRAK